MVFPTCPIPPPSPFPFLHCVAPFLFSLFIIATPLTPLIPFLPLSLVSLFRTLFLCFLKLFLSVHHISCHTSHFLHLPFPSSPFSTLANSESFVKHQMILH